MNFEQIKKLEKIPKDKTIKVKKNKNSYRQIRQECERERQKRGHLCAFIISHKRFVNTLQGLFKSHPDADRYTNAVFINRQTEVILPKE